jgi:hypothetical protein
LAAVPVAAVLVLELVAAGVVAVLPATAAVVDETAAVVPGSDVAGTMLVATGTGVVAALPVVTGLDELLLSL